MKRETPVVGYKDGIPIIACRISRVNYVFYCQYCRRNHLHGIGDGHRVAHCTKESPFTKGGYYLVGKRSKGGVRNADAASHKVLL